MGASTIPNRDASGKVVNHSEAFASKFYGDKKLFKRNHGSVDVGSNNPYVTVPANGSVEIDIEIGYAHCKLEGVEIIGAGKKHSADFKIFDDASGTYSTVPNYELNQFAFGSAIAEGYHKFNSKYDADLYMGMIVTIEIFNNSSSASEVAVNLDLNQVV